MTDLAMKLWLLQPIKGLPADDDPWEPWYDKAFGFVVRAETEEQARQLAYKEGGDERGARYRTRQIEKEGNPWIDPRFSTCVELTADGPAGVIIRDFASA